MRGDCVGDTHALIWYLYQPKRLSQKASRAFEGVLKDTHGKVFLSTVSLVEITYLVERKRIKKEFVSRLYEILDEPFSQFEVIPITVDIARAVEKVSWRQVPDMPDRIIAATALHLDLPLVTADHRIRASSIKTIW